MEQLQQDLSTPKEPEIPLSRIESQSQDDHASNNKTVIHLKKCYLHITCIIKMYFIIKDTLYSRKEL